MALTTMISSWPIQPAAYAAVSAQTGQAQAEATLQLVKEDIVTSGAILRTYKWYPASDNNQKSTDLRVIVVDLANPYVELNVMNGKGGELNSKQSVLAMAKETSAVAGINASFFHMYDYTPPNPLGTQITNGQLTVSPLFLKGWYAFGITADRKPVIAEYDFDGVVSAGEGTYRLNGINKPIMSDESNNKSHVDSIFMYTSTWGANPRPALTRPVEVLVVGGIAIDMSTDGPLSLLEIPKDGYILRGEGKGAEFLKNHVKIGEPVYTSYQMRDRNTGASVDPTQFQMLIGGHTLMVDNGQKASFTVDINNVSGAALAARTAIGYSADGRYVYLITADKTSTSRGMTLKELQEAMIQLGVWRGINLDGGGSTTMVARELGETTPILVNQPAQGSMRQVVNGIGVYTNAPAGEVTGLILGSIPFLFVGEQVKLPVKGYDQYYNPVTNIDLSRPEFALSVTDGYGRFENGYFIPTRTGKATITIAKGSFQVSTDVEIVDRKELASLSLDVSDQVLRRGSSVKLKVKAALKDGRSREVPSNAVEWRIEGFTGSIRDGVLTVEEVDERSMPRIIASYDGYSTSVVLPTLTDSLWADFDTMMPPLSLQLISEKAIVDYRVTNRLQGQATASNVLNWRYDYSQIGQISGKPLPRIAFEFNEGQGMEVAGKPHLLKLDVFGDGKSSTLWLEATDAKGKQHTIHIGKIDWTGWRTLEIDLEAMDIKAPMTVNRLVQESPSNPLPAIDLSFITFEELMAMVDPTVTQGELAIDNIVFQTETWAADPENKTIEMQINNHAVTVNGQTLEIDQPPVIIGQSTMVPIRFIVEAMDGEVEWDAARNKVTLIRGKQFIELWLDERDINYNGKKVTAPQAPTAKNWRTLVPLRVLSELLGWEVYWDNDTQSVKMVGKNQ
jgi:hypothetical protein